jgi:hypothetical protein
VRENRTLGCVRGAEGDLRTYSIIAEQRHSQGGEES